MEVLDLSGGVKEYLNKIIKCIKYLYKDTCLITKKQVEKDEEEETEIILSTINRDKKMWTLDNNIILDASAKLNPKYAMNKDLYIVMNNAPVLDHSLWNIKNIWISSTKYYKALDIKYKTEWTFNGCCAENMDIQIYDLNDTGSLNIAYDYKTSIYEQTDIEKLHQRILYIIRQVISKQQIQIKDIEIVTPEEKKILVKDFNKTELKYDRKETVISLFEKQVEKTPEKVAIKSNHKKLTYKILNEKQNQRGKYYEYIRIKTKN